MIATPFKISYAVMPRILLAALLCSALTEDGVQGRNAPRFRDGDAEPR